MSNEERKNKKQGGWSDLLNDLGIDAQTPVAESTPEPVAEVPAESQPEPYNEVAEIPAPEPQHHESATEQPVVEKKEPLITWDPEPKKEWNLSEIFDNVVPPPPSARPKELERFPKIDLFGPAPNKAGPAENIFFKHEPKKEEHVPPSKPAKPAKEQRSSGRSNDPWSKIASQLGVLSGEIEENPAEAPKTVAKADADDDRGNRRNRSRNRGRNERNAPEQVQQPRQERPEPQARQERERPERKEQRPQRGERQERKPETLEKPAPVREKPEQPSREKPARGRRSLGFGSGIIEENEAFFAIDTASLDSGFAAMNEPLEEVFAPQEPESETPDAEDGNEPYEKRSRCRRRRSKKERPIYSKADSGDEYALEVRVPETDNLDLEFEEDAPEEAPKPARCQPRGRGRGVRSDAFSPEETVFEEDVEETLAPRERELRESRENRNRRRPKPAPVAAIEDDEPDPVDMEEIRQHVHKSIPTWGDAVATVVEGNMTRHASKKQHRPKRR